MSQMAFQGNNTGLPISRIRPMSEQGELLLTPREGVKIAILTNVETNSLGDIVFKVDGLDKVMDAVKQHEEQRVSEALEDNTFTIIEEAKREERERIIGILKSNYTDKTFAGEAWWQALLGLEEG